MQGLTLAYSTLQQAEYLSGSMMLYEQRWVISEWMSFKLAGEC